MAKHKRKRKHSRKACLVTSGRKKGKPKKGWRLGKGGRCIKAKGKR